MTTLRPTLQAHAALAMAELSLIKQANGIPLPVLASLGGAGLGSLYGALYPGQDPETKERRSRGAGALRGATGGGLAGLGAGGLAALMRAMGNSDLYTRLAKQTEDIEDIHKKTTRTINDHVWDTAVYAQNPVMSALEELSDPDLIPEFKHNRISRLFMPGGLGPRMISFGN